MRPAVVAREGRFLRGRLASGLLRHLGLDELVAESDEAYVELAAALAGDRERRQALRERIEAGRERLYRDAGAARRAAALRRNRRCLSHDRSGSPQYFSTSARTRSRSLTAAFQSPPSGAIGAPMVTAIG